MGEGVDGEGPEGGEYHRDEHLLRGRPLHHRAAPQDHRHQRLGFLPRRHHGRGGHGSSARGRRQMVREHERGRPHALLRLHGHAHPLQGPCDGRIRRLQQEHRHRLRRRPHRQEVDPCARGRRPVERRPGRAHGEDLRVHQGNDRLLRQARHLCERDAQHERLLRLRGCARPAGRHAQHRHPLLHRHRRHRHRLRRPRLRDDRRRPRRQPRPRRAHAHPPQHAPAQLHARARHGQLELHPHRPRQRRQAHQPHTSSRSKGRSAS